MTAESAQETGPRTPPGDASAWLELHGDALYRFARGRVGDRTLAEDLVQETLLAALQARGRFREQSSVRTWLVSILRHKIADAYRRGAASRGRAGDGPAPGILRRFFTDDGFWRRMPSRWKGPQAELLDAEFHRVLDGCLGELPGPLSEAFAMRALERAEMPEVCERLGLSPGNLRVRLHRARLLLRDCLERKWFDPRPDDAPGDR